MAQKTNLKGTSLFKPRQSRNGALRTKHWVFLIYQTLEDAIAHICYSTIRIEISCMIYDYRMKLYPLAWDSTTQTWKWQWVSLRSRWVLRRLMLQEFLEFKNLQGWSSYDSFLGLPKCWLLYDNTWASLTCNGSLYQPASERDVLTPGKESFKWSVRKKRWLYIRRYSTWRPFC